MPSNITIGETYRFKDEFCPILNIPMHQVDRKLTELLDWLTNFFDYDFKKGRPNLITIKEIYGDYQPLPRKAPKQDALNKAKKQDYEQYTISALGPKFKPNSKSKVARDAIEDFGYKKYNHSNYEAVAKRFIKEPFDKYGETDNKSIWVWYSTYEEPEAEVIEKWCNIMREEHIAEQEAANAFYRQEQGEDISKEKDCYNKARKRFKTLYGDCLVLVKNWRLKSMGA